MLRSRLNPTASPTTAPPLGEGYKFLNATPVPIGDGLVQLGSI